eukprot:7167518-Pyramimonas_sp.AAC.1
MTAPPILSTRPAPANDFGDALQSPPIAQGGCQPRKASPSLLRISKLSKRKGIVAIEVEG